MAALMKLVAIQKADLVQIVIPNRPRMKKTIWYSIVEKDDLVLNCKKGRFGTLRLVCVCCSGDESGGVDPSRVTARMASSHTKAVARRYYHQKRPTSSMI